MVGVRFFRGPDGLIDGFVLDGHTECAPHGEDVVCAGVSALAQSILLGLVEVVKADVDFCKNEGFLECKVLKHSDQREIQVLLNTFYLSMKRMEEDYPKFIKVKED